MRTLQNDFTTPEQSKRLLELGVPVDSADGFYSRESYRGGKWERPKLFESEKDKVNFNSVYEGGIQMYLPLYTAGRLIEIYCTCRECTWKYTTNNQLIEDILCDIELYIEELDFSKLEEE